MVETNHMLYQALIALAGRRIDPPHADPPRFPLENVPIVRRRISALLSAERAEALVCSAACGADLIALEEAERLGLRRRIVLPFPAKRFRETSVIDRPGNWGVVFDRMVVAAGNAGDLLELHNSGDEEAAYAAANRAIVHQAKVLAKANWAGSPLRLVAAIVWEGSAKAGTDASCELLALAREAGFEVRYLLTG
jgi:hypothetical protein